MDRDLVFGLIALDFDMVFRRKKKMIKTLQVFGRILQVALSGYAIYYVLNEWRIQRLVERRVSPSYKR